MAALDWVSAIKEFAGGTLFGSILTVLLKDRLDWRTRREQARRDRVAAWRDFIAKAPDFATIRTSTVYDDLRPFMKKEEAEQFRSNRFYVTFGGGGISNDDIKKSRLLEVVKRIEEKWKLI